MQNVRRHRHKRLHREAELITNAAPPHESRHEQSGAKTQSMGHTVLTPEDGGTRLAISRHIKRLKNQRAVWGKDLVSQKPSDTGLNCAGRVTKPNLAQVLDFASCASLPPVVGLCVLIWKPSLIPLKIFRFVPIKFGTKSIFLALRVLIRTA